MKKEYITPQMHVHDMTVEAHLLEPSARHYRTTGDDADFVKREGGTEAGEGASGGSLWDDEW